MLEGLIQAGVIPVVADGVESLTRIDGRPDVPQRLEEGVKAFQAALEVRTRDRSPFEWGSTQNNLAAALVWLGERQQGDESLQGAVTASRNALEVWTRDQSPYDWARAQGNLGNALCA